MTEEEYQSLYQSGKLNAQDRVDYERFLSLKAFIQSMQNQVLGDDTEVISMMDEPVVYVNDETIRNKTKNKIKKNKASVDQKLAASAKSVFTYKGDTKPKKPVTLLKNVELDYGPVPGFKRPLDNKGNKQGYYDADENSEFWKTDAGYEKAMQTWGKDGGVLPQFVKKPVKKELDISAIKKLFGLNK